MISVAVLAGGCGTTPRTSVHPSPVSATASDAAAGSGGGNEARALAETRYLLTLPVLPASASMRSSGGPELTGPIYGTPGTSSVLDSVHFYEVPLSYAQAGAYVADHPPAGLTSIGSASGTDKGVPSAGKVWSAPDGDGWTGAQVQISYTPDGATATLWRVDGIALWLDPTPAPDDDTGPRLRPTSATVCPTTVTGIVGVRNSAGGLATSMLPLTDATGALVCGYRSSSLGPGATTVLYAHRVFPAAAATTIAAAAHSVSLDHLDNQSFSCPATFERAVLVVFAFPGHHVVSLWDNQGGCGHDVANGVISALMSGPFEAVLAADVPGLG